MSGIVLAPGREFRAMRTGKVAESLFGGGTERKVVLCDGAMGSMLYGRGVFINRCYD